MKMMEVPCSWNLTTYLNLEYVKQLAWRYEHEQFHLYAYYPGDDDSDAVCVLSISEEPFNGVPNDELPYILNKMMSLVMDCNILSKRDLIDSLEHAAKYIIERYI